MNPLRTAVSTLSLAVSALAQVPPVNEVGLLPGDTAIAPAANGQQDLNVARGGAVYLAVWSDYRARKSGSQTIQSDGDIFGIRLDANGAPIDPAPFLIAGGMGLQHRPKVAWNGENWLVIYESQEISGGYYDTFIQAVRVSAQGQTLDASPLALPLDLFSPSNIGLTVSGANGQWLIARCVYHNDGYGTYLAGQRIGGTGQLLDPAPIMLNDWVYGPIKVMPSSGEYLAVGPEWNDGSSLKARRINTNLQPLAPSFSLPANAQDIAGSGNDFFVTWIADFVRIVGSRMTGSGSLLNPAGTELVPPNSGGAFDLEYDGSNWWFARTVSNSAYTTLIGPGGQPVGPRDVPLPIDVQGSVNSLYDTQLVPRAGGGVLYCWTDYRAALGNDSNGFALPVSPQNTGGAEHCLTTSTPSQRNPSITAGPAGTLAVAFVSESSGADRVLVSALHASGVPLPGGPIVVASSPNIGRPGIAWNGSLFMITWDQGIEGPGTPGIKARRMLPDGSFLDAAPIDIMPGFNADVESLGDDFLIAGARYGSYPQYIDLWANRIEGPTGARLDGPLGLLLGGGYVSGAPRVRADGAQWFVAAHSMWTHNSSQGDAILARVPPGGAPVAAVNPTPYSGGTGDLDIASSGSNHLLVWRMNSLANANNYIAGRIMNLDGTYGPAFTIAEATGRQLRPTVVWDGQSYIVALDDQRNQDAFFDDQTDVYAVRIGATGSPISAAFPIVQSAFAACSPDLVASGGNTVAVTTRFITAPPFDSYRVGVTRIGDAHPPCAADLGRQGGAAGSDGLLDNNDFVIFIDFFFNHNPLADLGVTGGALGHDQAWDNNDFVVYVDLFFTGCQ